MAGNLGLEVDLDRVPVEDLHRDDTVLFSESAGRFVVTVDPRKQAEFEELFQGVPCACIGMVTSSPKVVVRGLAGDIIVAAAVHDLKYAWKKPFGDLI